MLVALLSIPHAALTWDTKDPIDLLWVSLFICLSVGIATPAIAFVYYILSPLGKEYVSGVDEEAQI